MDVVRLSVLACSLAMRFSSRSLDSMDSRRACASRCERLTSWAFCAVSTRCSWMPRMPALTR